MTRRFHIDLIDIVRGVSECVDLVNSLFNHHLKRVACIALNIAQEMNLPWEERRDILIASLLHDVGALSIKERLKYLEFESDFETKSSYGHAEIGYKLFRDFKPFLNPALFIRYHHTYYKDIGEELPLGAYILHLADRIAISIRNEEVLKQREGIIKRVVTQKNRMFHPDVVDVFLDISRRESFWFDGVYMPLDLLIKENNLSAKVALDLDELLVLALVFHTIIDFRSRFTVFHSCGVAGVAVELAKNIGFSESELKFIEIAGYLHDVGKIAIPIEILEKPDRLTEEESNIIKLHVYYSYRILEQIEGLEIINEWGSFHHERLDGSGYPFGIKGDSLSLGSRIMAIADVFTALIEDRPYRKGMSIDEALDNIRNLVEANKLDKYVFSVLEKNAIPIGEKLSHIKEIALERFLNFYSEIKE